VLRFYTFGYPTNFTLSTRANTGLALNPAALLLSHIEITYQGSLRHFVGSRQEGFEKALQPVIQIAETLRFWDKYLFLCDICLVLAISGLCLAQRQCNRIDILLFFQVQCG
jgi:hypothetical protein